MFFTMVSTFEALRDYGGISEKHFLTSLHSLARKHCVISRMDGGHEHLPVVSYYRVNDEHSCVMRYIERELLLDIQQQL